MRFVDRLWRLFYTATETTARSESSLRTSGNSFKYLSIHREIGESTEFLTILLFSPNFFGRLDKLIGFLRRISVKILLGHQRDLFS